MAGKGARKARRPVRKSRSPGKGNRRVGDGTGAEAGAGAETDAPKPAGYVGPAGRVQQSGVEKPPIADPAKSEAPPTPPKPGYTAGGKKIGRPTKAMVAEDEAEKRKETIEDFCKALPELVEMPFNAAAMNRGDHWKIGDKSRDALCAAIKGCMYRYLPAALSEHLPLVSLIGLSTVLVSSRLIEDVRLDAERRKEAAARGRPGPGPGVVADAANPAA